MNLTVGPLAPAVYWRRRAIVLGALVVTVVLLVAMCNGTGTSGAAGKGAASPTPSAASGAGGAGPLTSAGATPTLLTPIIGGTGPSSGTNASPSSQPGDTGTGTGPAVVALPACTDAQMGVTVVAQALQVGFYLTLTVRNTSPAGCSRDVGAGAQEIYVALGSTVVWTSDCLGGTPVVDVRNFNPGIWASFRIYWDGYRYANCARQGPHPAGVNVFGKVGAIVSPAVPIPAGS